MAKAVPRMLGSNSKNDLLQSDGLGEIQDMIDSYEAEKLIILSFYLNNVTEICIDLLSKSDLNREKKINIRAEIKKGVWNYEEDVAGWKISSFQDYFDKLFKAFQ